MTCHARLSGCSLMKTTLILLSCAIKAICAGDQYAYQQLSTCQQPVNMLMTQFTAVKVLAEICEIFVYNRFLNVYYTDILRDSQSLEITYKEAKIDTGLWINEVLNLMMIKRRRNFHSLFLNKN